MQVGVRPQQQKPTKHFSSKKTKGGMGKKFAVRSTQTTRPLTQTNEQHNATAMVSLDAEKKKNDKRRVEDDKKRFKRWVQRKTKQQLQKWVTLSAACGALNSAMFAFFFFSSPFAWIPRAN